MRIGEVVRVDPPATAEYMREHGFSEKIEKIPEIVLRRQIDAREDWPNSLSELEKIMISAREIAQRRNAGQVRLLSIYRRTQKVYDCHIQFQEPLLDPATVIESAAFTLTMRRRNGDPINIIGGVRIRINGQTLRPLLDFRRDNNVIHFMNIPEENSEIIINYTTDRGAEVTGGYWHGGWIAMPANDRVLDDTGTVFVNGMRVGEVRNLQIGEARNVNAETAEINRRSRLRDASNNSRMIRRMQISVELLAEVSIGLGEALNVGSTEQMERVIEETIRPQDAGFIHLEDYHFDANLMVVTANYTANPNIPVSIERTASTSTAQPPEPPPLPDSKIVVSRPVKNVSLDDLENEDIIFRRKDRSDIMD